eukprot:597741-Alexandrium_andersonii.AAC.1
MEGWGAECLALTRGFGDPVGAPTHELWEASPLRFTKYFKSTFQNVRQPITITMVVVVACPCRNDN